MSVSTIYLVIIGVGLFFAWKAYAAVLPRIREKENPQEWLQFVLWPGVIMILVLAVNGGAFLKVVGLEHAMLEAEGIDYHAAESSPAGGWSLMIEGFFVLVGTSFLMWLSYRALLNPRIYELRHPRAAGLLAQRLIVERLVFRHWLAVFGVGAVFGVATGGGPVLLLAVELTLMWMISIVGIRFVGGSVAAEEAAEVARTEKLSQNSAGGVNAEQWNRAA
ncbi:MAG: hypothetical protein ACF8PN_03010 [Phycisphaerales bacterium]